MEINVVLAHELVKADVIGVQPPLFPFGCIAGCDTQVSQASVELVWALFPNLSHNIDQCLPKHLKGKDLENELR